MDVVEVSLADIQSGLRREAVVFKSTFLRQFIEPPMGLMQCMYKPFGSYFVLLSSELVSDIKTPSSLLNTAYDSWQSLAPPTADPGGIWNACKSDHSHCNLSQIQFLQEFRNQRVLSLNAFSESDQNALFINSCFVHCQPERQDTWFAQYSPQLNGKRVAEAVGDWYFDRTNTGKNIGCPYPCDTTCHNLIFE